MWLLMFAAFLRLEKFGYAARMHHGKHKAEILYMGVSQSQKLLVICWSLTGFGFFLMAKI